MFEKGSTVSTSPMVIVAGIDRSAQAATILDGDGDALVLDAVEHGVGDEVAHRAFSGAADFARSPLIRSVAVPMTFWLQFLERLGHFRRGGLMIAGSGVTEASSRIGSPFGVGDDAVVIAR